MGAMFKEIREVCRIEKIEMDTDFISFYTYGIVSIYDLEKIQKILKKYGYSRDYLSVMGQNNLLKVTFCSKLYGCKFY